MKKRITCIVLSLATLAATAEASGAKEFDIPRAEFAKYYRQIVGTDAPDGLIAFAIDPKVSKSGKDAYTIVSGSGAETERQALMAKPLESLRPTLPRTEAQYRKTMLAIAEVLEGKMNL